MSNWCIYECFEINFWYFALFQDTDAQNNIILEETEDEEESKSPNTIPVNVTANTTFLHLHADIPFADDDDEEDDAIKDTNESNTNKGSNNLIGGRLNNQNNKNQLGSSLSGRSFVISRTPIVNTSDTTTSTTTTTTTTEGNLETTKSTEGTQETSVQVHNCNNEHNNTPTPVSNSSFLANQHQPTVNAAGTVAANEHQPSCNVVASQHECTIEHDVSSSQDDAPVESLVFAQSVFPMEQYDEDEIFV